MPTVRRPRCATAVRAGLIAVAALSLNACASTYRVGQGVGGAGSATGYMSEIRTSQGLAPLAYDARLEAAALEQAGYMARSGRMDHTTGWGRDFSTRMGHNSIGGPAAENIAAGRMDMRKVFQMWMDSPPHRRNMLDPRMSRFGVAYVPGGKDGQTRYWALVLSK